MTGDVLQLARRRRRWRLTRRGRVVVGVIGVLLLAGVGSLVEGPAADLARAAGLGGDTGDLTLVASGDVLPHGPVLRRAADDGARAGQRYDFRPMLAELRPLVAGADLALCHLEVPLSRDGRAVASWPSFNAPPELAAASTIVDVRGLRVGLLSYAYGLNSGRLPSGQPWLVNLIDPARIVGDARGEHQVSYRYVVLGYVTDAQNRGRPGVQVELRREKTGFSYLGETDTEGFYLIVARLGDESLGEALQLRAANQAMTLTARFDPADHATERGTRVDFTARQPVESPTAFAVTLKRYLTQ